MTRKPLTTLTAALALGAAVLLSASPARAATISYAATLSGADEAPPNASTGTGSATVTFDTVSNAMRVQVTFSGLTGTTTAAHIHCCTTVPFTGTTFVATTLPSFVGFPLGVTSGSMDHTYDMLDASSYRAQFITDHGGTLPVAFAALMQGTADGKAYFNIHTSVFGGGEIRGFLRQVPEPGSLALFGLAAVAFARRRDRR